MINAHESGSNSTGAGNTLSKEFDQTKSLQGFYLGFAYGKSISPPFPGPRRDVVASD